MSKELVQRIATSLIGIPVLLGILFFDEGVLVTPLITVVLGLLLWELCSVASTESPVPRLIVVLTGCSLFVVSQYWQPAVVFLDSIPTYVVFLTIPLFAFIWLGLLSRRLGKSTKEGSTETDWQSPPVARYFPWGFVCVALACLCMCIALGMIASTYGAWLLLSVLAICWLTDIAAYFIGKAIGKRLIFPRMSPKKTLEGTIGGFLVGLVTVFFVWLLVPAFEASIFTLVFMLVTLPLLAIMGDLIESAIKRLASVKDSGSILPGHGGLLDRLDSVIFVPGYIAFIAWIETV